MPVMHYQIYLDGEDLMQRMNKCLYVLAWL